MKYRNKIEGVVFELDDGDKSTDGVVELHGELAEEADDELITSSIKILRTRGYLIVNPKFAKWCNMATEELKKRIDAGVDLNKLHKNKKK